MTQRQGGKQIGWCRALLGQSILAVLALAVVGLLVAHPVQAQFWRADKPPVIPDGPGQLIIPPKIVQDLSPEKRAALGWQNTLSEPMPRRAETIDIDTLGTLEVGQVGIDLGYGPDVWHGARAAFVIPALKRLPPIGSSRVLRHLEIAVLQGSARPPRGSEADWFASRVRRLLDVGEIRSVRAMVEMTGAAKRDAQTAQVYAESYLLAGDLEGLCALRPSLTLARDTIFYVETDIMCHLARGDKAAATLALELHDGPLQADPFFRELAFMYAVDAPQTPRVIPPYLSATQFALMRLVGVPITAALSAFPVAAYPYLAQSYDVAPRLQIAASLASVELGLLPVEHLRAVLSNLGAAPSARLMEEPSAGDVTPPAPIEGQTEAPAGERGDPSQEPMVEGGGEDPFALPNWVPLWIALDQGQAVSEPEALQALLTVGLEQNAWYAMSQLLAPHLDRLVNAAEPALQPLAFIALLSVGQVDLAEQVIQASDRAGAPLSLLTVPARELVPLWRGGLLNVPASARRVQGDIDLLVPTSEPLVPRLVRALRDQDGASLSGASVSGASVSGAAVTRADQLALAGRLGDLAIYLQEHLGSRPVADWTAEEAELVVRTLRRLGLQFEAAALVREIILAGALRQQQQAWSANPPRPAGDSQMLRSSTVATE